MSWYYARTEKKILSDRRDKYLLPTIYFFSMSNQGNQLWLTDQLQRVYDSFENENLNIVFDEKIGQSSWNVSSDASSFTPRRAGTTISILVISVKLRHRLLYSPSSHRTFSRPSPFFNSLCYRTSVEFHVLHRQVPK